MILGVMTLSVLPTGLCYPLFIDYLLCIRRA